MRYELPYNSNKQLSPHINAQELRCKCGGTHNIIVDTDLIDKIEQLISAIAEIKGVDSKDVHINVSSANRCRQRDISVGGLGWGMHVVGKALDYQITCKGTIVDSKLIACIAQEMGFNGIGRIKSVGEYIHSDVGTIAEHGNKKWLGDETVSGGTSGSVINEPDTYWRYYGMKRSEYIKSKPDGSEPDNKTNDKEKDNEADIKGLQTVLNAGGAGLVVDGIVGNKTLTAAKRYSIENGDKGNLIKWVQNRLNQLGFDCGAADGIVGNKTMSAIYAWQKSNGLGQGTLYGSDWDVLLK